MKKVLAIGAHFDDVEIGMGGTLAKLRAQGVETHVYVVTHSEYTDVEGTVRRSREVALAEGKKASEVLGYTLHCGNHDTKYVQPTADLVQDMEAIINDVGADTVFTHWDGDVHQDHAAIANASIAAARKVPRLLMYQSNLYINTSTFDGTFVIDISDHIDAKIEAIKAHASEVSKFGQGWLEFWLNQARNDGQRFNVRYAEVFKQVKYLL